MNQLFVWALTSRLGQPCTGAGPTKYHKGHSKCSGQTGPLDQFLRSNIRRAQHCGLPFMAHDGIWRHEGHWRPFISQTTHGPSWRGFARDYCIRRKEHAGLFVGLFCQTARRLACPPAFDLGPGVPVKSTIRILYTSILQQVSSGGFWRLKSRRWFFVKSGTGSRV